MQDAQNLVQAAKVLLTNEGFKTDFKATKVPKSRRNFIQTCGTQMGWVAEVAKAEDRESIRLLLEHLLIAGAFNVGTPTEPSYNLDQMLEAYNTTTTTPSHNPITTTTPSHNPITTTNTMSKAITVTTQVTTQVNVNGVNADNYTDAQLFDMIRQQETAINNLQALANKPQALLREITTRQAGIEALVSFMNERDAKLNPQPTEPIKPTGPGPQNLQAIF